MDSAQWFPDPVMSAERSMSRKWSRIKKGESKVKSG